MLLVLENAGELDVRRLVLILRQLIHGWRRDSFVLVLDLRFVSVVRSYDDRLDFIVSIDVLPATTNDRRFFLLGEDVLLFEAGIFDHGAALPEF